jgi:uncharacterized delta-60 repeat protein
MKVMSHAVRLAAACLLLALGACGGGGDGGSDAGTSSTGTVIGAAGGTVVGPNGVEIVIPPGALAADTMIAIEQTSAGSPALPAGFSVVGQMFAFTPHGTSFAVPVTVTLPFDPATVPAGKVPALFKTNAQNQWEQVASATFGANTVSAQITSFSWQQIGGMLRNDPVREWSFRTFPGNGQAPVKMPCDIDNCKQVGGLLEKTARFGKGLFDHPYFSKGFKHEADGSAEGLIASSADGTTYGVFAEAPFAAPDGPDPIGSISQLTQTQSFKRISANASLTFTLTSVFIDATDFFSAIGQPPRSQDRFHSITGEVSLSVRAYKTPGNDFYFAGGTASVNGRGVSWTPQASDDLGTKNHLWSLGDFDFSTTPIIETFGAITGCPGTGVVLKLKAPRAYTVDLSTVGDQEEFTLEVNTTAEAFNRNGSATTFDCRMSSVSAFLRDPLEIGGTTLTIAGLEPTNKPLPAPPPTPALVEPASCVPGPGPKPEAGVLQFDAATYTIDEFAGAVSTVMVTRTGGSSGAVSATFTTSDGTALGGVDYTPVNATVFFADGDVSPRLVRVPIIPDLVDEIGKTVNLTLSQPGGCAALGLQSTAVLTIVDDDARPALPSGLDTTFGNAGKATSTDVGGDPKTAFGGDRSAMALQADGKIVMVGGTFTDFILARFNADGSLDQGFGVGGKVITDMGAGNRLEEATAVAIQPDGKIVVAGYTAIPTTPPAPSLPPTFALARYNANGTLDTSFGSGGRVSGNVNGNAYAVAIQGDGKIVVAGEVSFPTTGGQNFSDFVVARFNANGNLDTSFGADVTGQVVTDLGLATNSARNLVLQPDGAIVVSGKPQGNTVGFDHTDMVRYLPNGLLDPTFGGGGKLTLAGALVGEGLALQSDGKLVLVGSITVGTFPASSTRFALMRLKSDGSPDTSFGTAGTVTTAFAVNAAAAGVALQRDGKIVAVGTTVLAVNPNFVVARYNADGSIDTTFGSDGNLSIDFFGFADVGENVLVQPDGKIVVGGQAQNNFDGYGLARINP